MASSKSATKSKPRSTKATARKAMDGFTAEERAAVRARVREMKSSGADGESEVLAKIAAMEGSDRAMAERIHAIVKATAPDLSSRTWYGMPAYAKGDKVIFFFKDARKFKTRYATLGFSDKANLDDGDMWPSEFALMKLTPEVEARITALIEQAVS